MNQDIASLDPVLLLVVVVIAAFTVAFILALWALRRTGVPVYSAAPWTVKMALELLELKDGERFCDLGCGLGRPLRAARRKAKVEATGYELNPFAILFLWATGITDWKIHVRCRDFRRADLSEFDAVYLYLVPHVLPEIAAQLERQLKAGTRVVSVDFPMPGWKAVKSKSQGQKVWLYVMGSHLPGPGEKADSEVPDVNEMFRQMMESSAGASHSSQEPPETALAHEAQTQTDEASAQKTPEPPQKTSEAAAGSEAHEVSPAAHAAET